MQRVRALSLTLLAGAGAIALALSPSSDSPDPADASATPDRPLVKVGVSGSSPAHAHASAADAAASERDDGLYRTDEVMVAVATRGALEQVAADYGLVVRDQSTDGLRGLVEIPAGESRAGLLAALTAHPAVQSAAPNAVMAGAAKKRRGGQTPTNDDPPADDPVNQKAGEPTESDAPDGAGDGGSDSSPPAGSTPPVTPPESVGELQWHLSAVQTPATPVALGRVKVAVLDTGVAYRDHEEDGRVYRVPPSLDGVAFDGGRDLVDGDDLPLDEHQHGTHITSLIASDGEVQGVAPGVTIVPVRVLDAHNRGTEYDLIEGIRYAVGQGVDVINMSLSFPPGYVPSVGLRDALRLAHSRGVVLVAAAGNDGRDDLPSWPAASPDVISVGAWTDGAAQPGPALYSNLGVSLDIMAPGGDLGVDRNADGYPDGLVGETISLRDPSQTGAWMFAGTSQATALVSGAAARMLADGARPHEVRSALLEGAEFWGEGSFMDGTGAGGLDISRSLDLVGTTWVNAPPRFGASLVAWPEVISDPGRVVVRARARVTVRQIDGTAAAQNLDVYGTRWGPDGAEPWHCAVSTISPTCDVVGEGVEVPDADTDPRATWAFAVEAVVERDVEVPYRPTTILWGSDALEVVLDAIDASPTVQDRLLAVRWSKEHHPDLGHITDGVMVFNAGTGLASSPFGVVFTPGAVQLQDDGPEDLDLDGTGLASSPIGLFRVSRLGIDGTGLASSPIGFSRLSLVAIDGTGLASSPIGFGAMDVFTPHGAAPSLGMGMDGTMLVLEDAAILGASAGANGAATRALLSSGGYQSADGYEVASLLVGSGAASVGLTAEGDAVASGSEGIEIPR